MPSSPRMLVINAAIFLSSCTAVGPEYVRPNIAPPAQFVSTSDSSAIEENWWQQFDDPLLTALVQETATRNFDVAEAAARVREARALLEAAKGGRLPESALTGSATRNRLSEGGQIPVGDIPGFERDFALFDAGFDASWEIDLWGRESNNIKAHANDLAEKQELQRSVLLSAIAETAAAYIDLRSAEASASAIAAQSEALQEKLRLSLLRSKSGEAPKSETVQIAVQAEDAAAQLPSVQANARVAAYRLALLTGRNPADLLDRVKNTGALPDLPATVSAGTPSDVLRRRPDIRAAEYRLAGATARVGGATADLYPRFALLGSIGQQSRDAEGLVSAGSTRFSFGPSLSWPVFQMGTIRAQIRAADARSEAAAINYERTILTALNESETAFARYARAVDRVSRTADAMANAAENEALAEKRYTAGEDNKLALMDAIAATARSHFSLVSAKADALRQAIAAYKSLGGGWQRFEQNETNSH
ncbi:MAG: TolC family protein [Parasphingorhabdus sp.]|uniref:TolC family protein n=1 Tax=Parasphingorhabdus sp. TaxID=2709688 RepID=UPI0030028908